MKLLSTYFSPLHCYLVRLSQHPILKHPHSMLLLDARPGVTPIQNNMQNDIAVYFKLYNFGHQMAAQEILDRMIAI